MACNEPYPYSLSCHFLVLSFKFSVRRGSCVLEERVPPHIAISRSPYGKGGVLKGRHHLNLSRSTLPVLLRNWQIVFILQKYSNSVTPRKL